MSTLYKQYTNERGQGLVEYALVLVFVAVIVMVILSAVAQASYKLGCNASEGISGEPCPTREWRGISITWWQSTPTPTINSRERRIETFTAQRDGNNVLVTIKLSRSDAPIITDSKNNELWREACPLTCRATLTNVGSEEGVLTLKTTNGARATAHYGPAQSSNAIPQISAQGTQIAPTPPVSPQELVSLANKTKRNATEYELVVDEQVVGRLEVTYPVRMEADETKNINLTLRPGPNIISSTLDATIPITFTFQNESFTTTENVTMRFVKGEVAIFSIMSAELEEGGSFETGLVGKEATRLLLPNQPADWQWYITPKKSGSLPLTISISIPSVVDQNVGGDVVYILKTVPLTIDVGKEKENISFVQWFDMAFQFLGFVLFAIVFSWVQKSVDSIKQYLIKPKPYDLPDNEEGIDLVYLYGLVCKYFNNADINHLCFQMSINHEEFPNTYTQKVESLLLHLRTTNRILEFVELAIKERPRGDWSGIEKVTTQSTLRFD